jgi:hypothetical protein
MLTPRFLIGFTGHRSGTDEKVIGPPLLKVLTELKARAVALGGQAELYSSVAEGADNLCVEIARKLEMPVHLLLPLEDAEFEKDFSTPEAWKRSLDQITTARQRPGRDSVHQVSGEPSRPECYFNQAMHMLEAVDVLVAVWDQQPARGMGGTKEVIDQALATGVPVVQIASDSGEISGAENLVNCFKADAITTELNELAAKTQAPCADGAKDADGLQKCLDQIALTESGRFRPSLVRIILLHGFAALLAAAVTYHVEKEHWFYQHRWVFTATELCLVISALWMTIRLHQRHTQETWIRCRFACELVRGLRSSVPLIDPLHPSITRHDPKWKRFALSAGLLVLEHQHLDQALLLREHYLATRLGGDLPGNQILHYQTQQPAATFWWNFTGSVATWSARLAPVFVLLSLLNKLSGRHWHEDPLGWTIVAFLPIALPLLAGVASGIRQALDAGRRKDRYPAMVERLTEIKAAQPGLQTGSSIRRAITHSEEILLDELIEWQLAVKNTGAH